MSNTTRVLKRSEVQAESLAEPSLDSLDAPSTVKTFDVEDFKNTQAAACSVLKLSQSRDLSSDCRYQFDNLHEAAEEREEVMQLHALRIVKQAEKEAEEIKQSAFEQGYREGMHVGLLDADSRVEQQAVEMAADQLASQGERLVQALTEACDHLQAEFSRWQQQWDSLAIQLSLQIAEKIVRRQLAVNPEIAKPMIAEVLRLAAGSGQVRLRLNPADCELLGDQAVDFVRAAASCSEVEFLEDPSIDRGGCVVESHHGCIDAQLDTMFERLQDELLA